MPLYEYRCEKCGRISEFLESMKQENPDRRCKSCGDTKLTKVLSSCFVSKGSDSDLYQSCKTCSDSGGCGAKPCWEK